MSWSRRFLFTTTTILCQLRIASPPTAKRYSTRTSMGGFSEFLSNTKAKFLADLNADKAGDWTVVMGNEAGDLDSLASSLAYSYLASTLRNQPTIALIQTPRTDLYLRAENLFALQLASIQQEDLLCINDIPSTHHVSSFSKFALVDHNKLAPQYSGQGKVVGIIDHHKDEGEHADAVPRVIDSTVGSCASLVAREFQADWEASTSPAPPEVAALLISAIFIDTGGLKPGDKAVATDIDAVAFLSPRSSLPGSAANTELITTTTSGGETVPPLDALAKELSHRKKAVDHLSSRDLLRRDYKEYAFGRLPVGLSTVPYGLKNWLGKDGGFWKALESWMEERKLSVLGVLTTFSSAKKREHRREVVVLLRGDGVSKEMEKRLWKLLEKNKDLELQEKGQVKVGKRRARVWNQRNVKATRKFFAPLLGSILEGGLSTSSEVPDKKKG